MFINKNLSTQNTQGIKSICTKEQFYKTLRILNSCKSWSNSTIRIYKKYWHGNMSLSLFNPNTINEECYENFAITGFIDHELCYELDQKPPVHIDPSNFPNMLNFDLIENIKEYRFVNNNVAYFELIETSIEKELHPSFTIHVKPCDGRELDQYTRDSCICLANDIDNLIS